MLCLLILSSCLGFSTVSSRGALKLDRQKRRAESFPGALFSFNQGPELPSRPITATYDDDLLLQKQIDEYMELRRNQQQIDQYLMAMDPSFAEKTMASNYQNDERKQNVVQRIKDSGIAGIISFAIVQLAFWALSFPLVIFAFYRVTGHFPDFGDSEDIAKLGAESFTFVNIARLAAPFRIGFALSLVPWIQSNVIDPFQKQNE